MAADLPRSVPGRRRVARGYRGAARWKALVKLVVADWATRSRFRSAAVPGIDGFPPPPPLRPPYPARWPTSSTSANLVGDHAVGQHVHHVTAADRPIQHRVRPPGWATVYATAAVAVTASTASRP